MYMRSVEVHCVQTTDYSLVCFASTNTKQFCDVLAKQCGYLVVMPDWFRGKPITEEMLGNREEVMAWLGKVGTYEVVSKSSVRL